MNRNVTKRRQAFDLIAAELEALSDSDLAARLANATPLGSGIGGVRTSIEIGGAPVFVKKIPLTDVERLTPNIESTKDLFGLPLGCQYGVGSPGFGVWREIAANKER